MVTRGQLEPSPAERRAQEQIARRLAEIGLVLPGSVSSRRSRCGNPGCICHVDETRQHGPYLTWTRKFENKTLTRALSAEQIERYQPWFDEHRRLRQLTKDLEVTPESAQAG